MKYFAGKGLIELAGIAVSKVPCIKREYYNLVIIRVDRIGDYVLWHDTIAAYKYKFGNKKVLFVCNDTVASLAKEEQFFTDIVSFSIDTIKRSPKYALSFIRKLKGIRAETLVCSTWERNWYADIFSLSIKAKNKIGIYPKISAQKGFFINYYNRQYDYLYDCNECESEILADEMFAKKAIWNEYQYGIYPLVVNDTLPQLPDKFAVIAVSSSSVKRNWPIERFVYIINQIPLKYHIILVGHGQYDEICAEYIEKHGKNKNQIINYVNKTNLPEMVCLISKASFVIGNDSGAVHIASATNVPSIAIIPGAHYDRFLPYPKELKIKEPPKVVSALMGCFKCNYFCVFPNTSVLECINRVTIGMVEKELKSLLIELG